MELYQIHKPNGDLVPMVANISHSGQYVPAHIARQWTDEHRKNTLNVDWYLDRLYDFLPELGISILQATHSRYVVDLNRSLSNPIPGSFKTSVIADRNSRDQPVYISPPDEDELQERVYNYYIPYHQALYELLDRTVRTFGKAYLIDLHSFFGPHRGYEIILGDDDGQLCSPSFVDCLEQHYLTHGYKTGRNVQFTGGYIPGHYHKMPGVESIQVEIRYHTYLPEDHLEGPDPPTLGDLELSHGRSAFRSIFENVVQEVKRL
jgi:N-formylglutamate deformylase